MNHDLHDGISDQASASRQRLEDARVLYGLLGGGAQCTLRVTLWSAS